MEQTNIDYGSLIQSVSALVAIIAAICSAIVGIWRIIQRRKFPVVSYYVSRGVFADRVLSLKKLILLLKSDIKVINVYGKRGIGKSSFLRFFCDFTNCKLTRENKAQKKSRKGVRAVRGRAIYLHLSGDGTRSIDDQIISQLACMGSSLAEVAGQIAKTVRWKKIFVIIDNINNDGLSKEIEGVIDIFLSRSNRYRIIIGSIEVQHLLNIDEKQIQYIELSTFDENDIFDFAKKNDKSISPEYLGKILDFSEGLPVFVNLLLSNDLNTLSNITYDRNRMDSYLGRIINDLDRTLCIIAQYIGFLSITNPIFTIQFLKKFNIFFPDGCFEKLENCSLIEYDKESQTIKMHELFRDYICRHYSNSDDIIRKIYDYYCREGLLYEQVYYLVMIESETRDVTITHTIEDAISKENYAFLLMIGEHFKRLYGWNSNAANMSMETFLIIVYGYVSGLIGIGNYPAAREVIDKCKISARFPDTDIQFRFSMLTAQLYHLQNNYDESIASYKILLGSMQTNLSFKKYEAKCLWGIAHSFRHQGKDLDSAVRYYDESIRIATELGRKSEIIKSMREKLVILLCQERFEDARKLHQQICLTISSLPPNSYTGTRTAFLKTEVTYLMATGKKNIQLEYKLLQKVFADYKSQRKRLQYNTYFQFGEYYRHLCEYSTAKNYYNKALAFSKKNLDHNLETMSEIAISICEICNSEKRSSNEQVAIVHCIEICKQFDLHTNELLAELVLAYTKGTHVDSSIIRELECIKYADAIRAGKHMCRENLHCLNLFLM